jgi:hypothetical protein
MIEVGGGGGHCSLLQLSAPQPAVVNRSDFIEIQAFGLAS